MWNELLNQNDIDSLMETYGGFHDGCLVKLKYTSGVYVDEKLNMRFDASHKVQIIFQRQYRNTKTIEFEFEVATHLNIRANNVDEVIIYGASIFFFEDKIYWADCYGIKPPMENYKGTWVCAEKARWQIID